MRVRRSILALPAALMMAAPAPAQTGFTPPRLVSAAVPSSPMGAQSGGIAASLRGTNHPTLRQSGPFSKPAGRVARSARA